MDVGRTLHGGGQQFGFMASRKDRQIGVSGQSGSEIGCAQNRSMRLRARLKPRSSGAGVNNACCNFDWRRGVGGERKQIKASGGHGSWCVWEVIFTSALVCDGVVGRSQGDRDAEADDVVVGNRKDAEVGDRTSRMGIEATFVALRLAFAGQPLPRRNCLRCHHAPQRVNVSNHVTLSSTLTGI